MSSRDSIDSSTPRQRLDGSRAPSTSSGPRHRPLIVFAIAGAAIIAVRAVLGTRGGPTRMYNFSSFLSQVQSNHIRTAAIDPNGAVSGTLTSGRAYSSQIPTALQNPQLSGLL
ncbi:MAG TPA: hypothetical protein VGG90_00810, partial [Candidatus Dormibacteraeota bacterium]